MILGNKCDLVEKRQVPKDKGEMIAEEHNIPFLETSAKSNENVEKAFYQLAEAILDKTPNKESDNRGPVDIRNSSDSRQSKCCS
ncbi:DgyrCDS1646 [Dimorphilus gyrociliatus]|uniref:DgyrCDS1646 n=1 Tax=Dimorphilus gyrociliatus TaxID=2664684 RepID=A0A7I8VAT2_9ANNE|nr:DgyrCDS1646 [Dimorphilus gyrociliatus]